MYSSITMTTPILDPAGALMLAGLSQSGDDRTRGARRRRRFQRHSKLLKQLA
ncbi:hypothetical protein [Nocardioides mangrovi]|uniref:Uncharacterized protein n=1 Tax=Nocardioides mangrovi TaxID=2874580 RepID=A0ABS7U9I5_9ACTN|nr:hypothetical protein [Nocardioides mangrovi]MBZ5737648.1 hypothetical protein [Nocardioides mangrovi]